MKHLWKITILGIFFLAFILLWFFFVGFSAKQPGSFYNKGHNAVWIEHKWVGEAVSDAEIFQMVSDFQKYGINTVFVHTGPIEQKGVVDPKTYEYAIEFLNKAKKYDPKIQYQAWLGQIRSKIDLNDADVRHNIAKLSMTLTQLIGFDGVHFDIEPVWDEDGDFIELLKETRDLLPSDKHLSVALAEFIPQSVIWFTTNVYKFENYNSEVNYENVAKYADQIVTMAYDTGINYGFLYRWLLKEQVIWLTNILEGTELFIGIPAYEDKKEGFNPGVENIENGVKGVLSGLNNFRSNEENFSGIAIYPYWEMSTEEWGTFENLWLK